MPFSNSNRLFLSILFINSENLNINALGFSRILLQIVNICLECAMKSYSLAPIKTLISTPPLQMNCLLEVDEKVVISGSFEMTIHVWDKKNRERLREIRLEGNSIMGTSEFAINRAVLKMLLLQSQPYILVSVGKNIFRLNMGLQEVDVLRGHRKLVTSMAEVVCGTGDLSPGESSPPLHTEIWSASNDLTFCIWDAVTGKCLQTVPQVSKGRVLCLAFLQNQLWAGESESLISIWDTPNRKHVKQLKGHKDAVLDLAVIDDNREVWSASGDTTLCVWC